MENDDKKKFSIIKTRDIGPSYIPLTTAVWKSTDGNHYWGIKVGDEVKEVRLATAEEIATLNDGYVSGMRTIPDSSEMLPEYWDDQDKKEDNDK